MQILKNIKFNGPKKLEKMKEEKDPIGQNAFTKVSDQAKVEFKKFEKSSNPKLFVFFCHILLII